MSHAARELSRREYRREIRQRAWARTVERAGPWFRRLYEQVVRTLLLALLGILGLVGGGRLLFGQQVLSWQTVAQAALLGAVMALVVGLLLAIGFLGEWVFLTPYEFYKEVRTKAGKWLAKLNSTIKENQRLVRENERLRTGTDMAGLMRNLLEEIGRNKKLAGRQTGRPERVYLDTVIGMFQQRHISGPLANSLYALRQRITDQESLSQYPSGTVGSQFKDFCRPAMEEAEKEIDRYLAELEIPKEDDEGE